VKRDRSRLTFACQLTTEFAQAEDALGLAEQLRETSNLEQSLTVAGQGLDPAIEGRKHRPGTWLGDVTAGLGRSDLALRAKVVAFEEQPSPESYEAVRDQAGDRWPELQPLLIDAARRCSLPDALVDEAIAVAEREKWNFACWKR
jgi:hypothetical protein